MKKATLWVKTIAVIMVVIFSYTSIAMSAPSCYTIKVPEEYGKVTARYKASSTNTPLSKGVPDKAGDVNDENNPLAPFNKGDFEYPRQSVAQDAQNQRASAGENPRTVILIQDAHSNFSAQKNVARIINLLLPQLTRINADEPHGLTQINNPRPSVENKLRTSAKSPFVGIEGAIGTYDFKELRAFPLQEPKERVAEEYVKNGTFIGAEMANIIANQDFTLYGVEDKEAFLDNYKPFYQLSLKQSELEQEIEVLEGQLAQLKEAVYNSELKKFDQAATMYEESMIDFLSYMGTLYEYMGNQNIELFDYCNLMQFQETYSMKMNIDETALKEEMQVLVEELSGGQKIEDIRLPDGQGGEKTENRELNVGAQHAAHGMSAREYWEKYHAGTMTEKEIVSALTGLAAKQNVSISDYINIPRAQKYWNTYGAINMSQLLNEIKCANKEIRTRLSKTQDERTIISLQDRLGTLQCLLTMKAVAEDVAVFRKDKTLFSLERLREDIGTAGLAHAITFTKSLQPEQTRLSDDVVTLVDHFYTAADNRDAIMVNNLLSEMEKTNQQVGVLVAGGYHTDGMAALLKEKGVDYITVTPNIDSMVSDVAYMDRMMGKIIPFDPLMASHFTASRINAPLFGLGVDIEKIINKALPEMRGESLFKDKKLLTEAEMQLLIQSLIDKGNTILAEALNVIYNEICSGLIEELIAEGQTQATLPAMLIDELKKKDTVKDAIGKLMTAMPTLKSELGKTITDQEPVIAFLTNLQGQLEEILETWKGAGTARTEAPQEAASKENNSSLQEYEIATITQKIASAEARIKSMGIESIEKFALRTVTQQYFDKDPDNPFGINPMYSKTLFYVGVNPKEFYKAERGQQILNNWGVSFDLLPGQEESIVNQFLKRLYNTFTTRLGWNDGVEGVTDYSKSPLYIVIRGINNTNENQKGETPQASVDFSSPERALNGKADSDYVDWYSKNGMKVEGEQVSLKNIAHVIQLSEKEFLQVIAAANNYIEGTVRVYLKENGFKFDETDASPEYAQSLRNQIYQKYMAYYLYSKFITWLADDTERSLAQAQLQQGATDDFDVVGSSLGTDVSYKYLVGEEQSFELSEVEKIDIGGNVLRIVSKGDRHALELERKGTFEELFDWLDVTEFLIGKQMFHGNNISFNEVKNVNGKLSPGRTIYIAPINDASRIAINEHALIQIVDGKLTIRSLNHENGIYVFLKSSTQVSTFVETLATSEDTIQKEIETLGLTEQQKRILKMMVMLEDPAAKIELTNLLVTSVEAKDTEQDIDLGDIAKFVKVLSLSKDEHMKRKAVLRRMFEAKCESHSIPQDVIEKLSKAVVDDLEVLENSELNNRMMVLISTNIGTKTLGAASAQTKGDANFGKSPNKQNSEDSIEDFKRNAEKLIWDSIEKKVLENIAQVNLKEDVIGRLSALFDSVEENNVQSDLVKGTWNAGKLAVIINNKELDEFLDTIPTLDIQIATLVETFGCEYAKVKVYDMAMNQGLNPSQIVEEIEDKIGFRISTYDWPRVSYDRVRVATAIDKKEQPAVAETELVNGHSTQLAEGIETDIKELGLTNKEKQIIKAMALLQGEISVNTYAEVVKILLSDSETSLGEAEIRQYVAFRNDPSFRKKRLSFFQNLAAVLISQKIVRSEDIEAFINTVSKTLQGLSEKGLNDTIAAIVEKYDGGADTQTVNEDMADVDKTAENDEKYGTSRSGRLQQFKTSVVEGKMTKKGYIPDIHGNISGLNEIIQSLEEQGARQFVFLGDLFDRDRGNIEVFERMKGLVEKEKRAKLVLGNHDIWLIQALLGTGDLMSFIPWMLNGGCSVLQNVSIEVSKADVQDMLDKRDINKIQSLFQIAKSNQTLQDMVQFLLRNGKLFDIDEESGMLAIHAGVPLNKERRLSIQYKGFEGIAALNEMNNALKNAKSGDDRIFKELENVMFNRDIVTTDLTDTELRHVLNDLGVSGIVFGHSVQKGNILNLNDFGFVFGIDLGMAASYGDNGAALTIGNEGINKVIRRGVNNVKAGIVLGRNDLLQRLENEIQISKDAEDQARDDSATRSFASKEKMREDRLRELTDAQTRLVAALSLLKDYPSFSESSSKEAEANVRTALEILAGNTRIVLSQKQVSDYLLFRTRQTDFRAIREYVLKIIERQENGRGNMYMREAGELLKQNEILISYAASTREDTVLNVASNRLTHKKFSNSDELFSIEEVDHINIGELSFGVQQIGQEYRISVNGKVVALNNGDRVLIRRTSKGGLALNSVIVVENRLQIDQELFRDDHIDASKVSTAHAILTVKNGMIKIRDITKREGTTVYLKGNKFDVVGSSEGDSTLHEQYHMKGKFGDVLGRIAKELGIDADSKTGLYDFWKVVDAAGDLIAIDKGDLAGTVLQIEIDGTLSIISSQFGRDHYGRSQAQTYAISPVKNAHELAERQAWESYALTELGMTRDDIKNGKLKEWQKDIKNRATVIEMRERFHIKGLLAEHRFILATPEGKNEIMRELKARTNHSFISIIEAERAVKEFREDQKTVIINAVIEEAMQAIKDINEGRNENVQNALPSVRAEIVNNASLRRDQKDAKKYEERNKNNTVYVVVDDERTDVSNVEIQPHEKEIIKKWAEKTQETIRKEHGDSAIKIKVLSRNEMNAILDTKAPIFFIGTDSEKRNISQEVTTKIFLGKTTKDRALYIASFPLVMKALFGAAERGEKVVEGISVFKGLAAFSEKNPDFNEKLDNELKAISFAIAA